MISVNDNENSLIDCIEYVESFEIVSQGKTKTIVHGSNEFFNILLKLEKLFVNSRLMPAFGVSLHNETLNALQRDCWLKINFNRELTKNGLPFSSLVFKLEEVQGFNLIRQYNNTFDGRCLYLDLDENINLLHLINHII